MTRHLAILMLSLVSAGPLAAMEPPPNLDTALEAQMELVQNEPRNPVAQNDLGNLLALAGRFSEAEDAYHKAVELSPEETAPRFNLALLYQQTGRAQLAQAELEALLVIAPDHAWAHYQLGVLLAKKSRQKALNHYARALALDPALSFASNNPHILDNPLFEEALLRSQRFRNQPAANVPRQYGEAQRIIDLMVPPKEEATAETGPEGQGEEEAREGEAPESGTSGQGKTPRPVASAAEPAGSSPSSQLRPTRSVAAPTRSAATPPAAAPSAGRSAHEKPGASYTTIGTPPAARPDSRSPGTPAERVAADRAARAAEQREPVSGRRLRPAPPPSRDESISSSSDQPKPSNPPRSRYIPPSRRSTAQLELKLLPEEPAEKSG